MKMEVFFRCFCKKIRTAKKYFKIGFLIKRKYGATHLGNTVFLFAFIDFYIYPFQLTYYIDVLARIYFLLRPARNIS